jgi:hypothetical protein
MIRQRLRPAPGHRGLRNKPAPLPRPLGHPSVARATSSLSATMMLLLVLLAIVLFVLVEVPLLVAVEGRATHATRPSIISIRLSLPRILHQCRPLRLPHPSSSSSCSLRATLSRSNLMPHPQVDLDAQPVRARSQRMGFCPFLLQPHQVKDRTSCVNRPRLRLHPPRVMVVIIQHGGLIRTGRLTNPSGIHNPI